MSMAEQQFAEDRETRDAARAVFEARMDRVRTALGERSIPQRLTAEARERAVAVAEEGAEVAQENTWVLVSTGLAILAWVLRRPLINSAHALYVRLFKPEPASSWERLRNWTKARVKP
jgi:hypothetical protein